jgi:DNA polymerase
VSDLAPILEYLQAIGWEEIYLPAGTRRAAAGQRTERAGGSGVRHDAPPPKMGGAAPAARPPAPSRAVGRPFDPPPASAIPAAERAAALSTVAGRAAGCTACRLAEGRHTVVFGTGNPDADLMFIGEGPGAEEDRQGLPFVGPAGQLLTKIIGAIGLARDQVYIANVVKCRPPGNRDPQPDEVAACRSFLEEQVRLVSPRVIVALGRVAAQTLLGNELPVGRMRGEWHRVFGVPMRVTYHPAALLRNEALKRPTWEDMQVVRDSLVGQLAGQQPGPPVAGT